MEENKTADILPKDNTCINCGSIAVLKGYPNALCESCRENFIKFPIPLWIKLFAAGIGLIFLFSLYKIPKNIGLGVHLEKGKTAFAEKKYLTAQKELARVVKAVPKNEEAQGFLLMAAFYNEDFETMRKSFENLKGKRVDDEDLVNAVSSILDKSSNYFGNDSLSALLSRYDNDFTKVPDNVVRSFIDSNPDDVYTMVGYAARLSDKNEYAACDSLLQKVLKIVPDYTPALDMMTSIKRQENQLDESIDYCNRILSINKESVYALASKSRTLLKQKKDNEALSVAMNAFQLNEHNSYTIATLVLVYHFTNKTGEKAALLKDLSLLKDTASVLTLQYVKDVMSGKEPFRN